MQAPDEHRRKLALESWQVNAASSVFTVLFPEFRNPTNSTDSTSSAPVQSGLGSSLVSGERSETNEANEANDASESNANDSRSDSVDPARDLEAAVSDSDEPTECWICRDTTSEPLIQPCLCRGSMSGVHASCVEEWIRHHRRTATNDAPPQCSVCHQPYHGSERMPGVRDFVRHSACTEP